MTRGCHWRTREWFPDLSEEILLKLRRFHFELIYFNRKMNLISSRTEVHADQIHFADCVMGSQVILKRTKAAEIYDMGSGNGLPGLVMALLDPERKLVLIDKDAKKVEFLKLCAARLNLKNVEVRQCRLEDLGPVKCTVSRGFASISKIALLLEDICAPHGESYHFKSKNWVTEAQQISTRIVSMCPPQLVGEYVLPAHGPHLAIISINRF